MLHHEMLTECIYGIVEGTKIIYNHAFDYAKSNARLYVFLFFSSILLYRRAEQCRCGTRSLHRMLPT